VGATLGRVTPPQFSPSFAFWAGPGLASWPLALGPGGAAFARPRSVMMDQGTAEQPPTLMAATNKSLAQSNKSRTEAEATKKRKPPE